MRSNWSLLIASFSLLAVTACGSPGNVSYQGDEIVVKDPTGTVTAKAGKTAYPAELPVPQYPGSEMVVTATDTDPTNSSKSMAMLKSKDAAEKIIDFYKEKLTGSGWTIDSSMTGQMSYVAAKKGAQAINVSVISGGDDGNTISVSLQ